MPQDDFQREERRLIVALGFLAAVIAARPQTAGVVVFYLKLDVFIDWLLIPPWLVYALFMWLWFSDDVFKRGRKWFHAIGLSALAVQIFAVFLLFGVTGIAVYAPPIPLWLDPYLIDGYVLLIALGLGKALRSIVGAEDFGDALDKRLNAFFSLAMVGRQFVGNQLVQGWRNVLRRFGLSVIGPTHSRRAVRLVLLSISAISVALGWRIGGLSWLGLLYLLVVVFVLFIMGLALIGWSKNRREQTNGTNDGYERWAARRHWF